VSRFAATRELLAPVGDVWSFVAEPYHLSDWWPGVAGVEPDRRGLAPGARWQLLGPTRPGESLGPLAALTRAPTAAGTLVVLEVVPRQRLRFQFVQDRIDADLQLAPGREGHTRAALVVEAPFLRVRRSLPTRALARLHALVQTGAVE
jgi:uncharacterized protein YndB with AHSA1/START domain